MTDLERVRDYCDNPWEVFTDEEGCRGFRQKDRTGLVEAIDAHLKEDARLRKQVDQLAMMRGKQIPALWAENDRLREENASLVDRHNRESHGTASHEAMAYDQLKAENARLRAVVESYVASGPTNQELRDLYIKEHNENARLREDRNLGKRMFDDLELQAQDYEAELARLREVVKSKIEGKKRLKAENARLREDHERADKAYRTQALLASKLEAQRDDLLTALREIEREAQDPAVDLHTMMMVVGIARAAIAEVEGES